MITDHWPLRVDLPRDHNDSFEPVPIPEQKRRFTGFDERIIAMCARRMSVRENQACLAQAYGTELSPDFMNWVSDEMMAGTLVWQNRPLEPYPMVFFDA